MQGASNEMQEANFKPARYEDLTVEDEYLLSGEMVQSDEAGVVIPSSVAKKALGKSDTAELTKKEADKLIGKKITLLFAGRNSETTNTVKQKQLLLVLQIRLKKGLQVDLMFLQKR